MTRYFVPLALVAATTSMAACMSYSKRCSDGVCVITENGKTRYEGDPDKIAKIKAGKQAQAQAEMELQQRYDKAPRRGDGEPVRVALVTPTVGSEELAQHVAGYQAMLLSEFASAAPEARIQIVGDKEIRTVSQFSTSDDPHSGFSSSRGGPQVDLSRATPELIAKLRNNGVKADVVVFTHLAPKKKTGFVQGGGGRGLAQVDLVELRCSASSIYNFKEHQFADVGNSTSSFSAVGLDKHNQRRSAELKFERKIEKDRPAIKRIAQAIIAAVEQTIRPSLPSLAAVDEIQSSSAAGAGGGKEARKRAFMQKLGGMFGSK